MIVKKNKVIMSMADEINIKIIDSGYAYCDENWNIENEHSPYSRMYYIASGSANITINDETIPMTAGNMYFIPSGTTFSHRCYNKMEQLYFHINIIMPSHLDYFDNFNTIVNIKDSNLNNILDYYNNATLCDSFKLKVFLYEDIIKSMEKMETGTEHISANSPLVNETIKYIEKNISAKLRIPDITRELYVSESKLTKDFQKEIGIQLGKYIDKILTYKIEKLLISENLSISEICEKYQFNDRTYLTRFFKRNTGITPAEYKKRMKRNSVEFI